MHTERTSQAHLSRTLEAMQQAPNLYRWIFDEFRPFIGEVVLEIGAGVGSLTHWFLREPECRVYATDVDDGFLEVLRATFATSDRVVVQRHDACVPFRGGRFGPPDTIVCVNVLEHIADDVRALQAMAASLRPDGRLLLLVPAHAWLYGTVDRAIGHHRRYSRRTLRERIAAAGFRIERLYAFNGPAILGWLIQGKILRRPHLDPWKVRLYDRWVPLIRRLPGIGRGLLGTSWIAIARTPGVHR